MRNRATRKKRKSKRKKPVSARSARNAGRSRDTNQSVFNTRNYAGYEEHVCDAFIAIEAVVYFRKQRKNKTPNGPKGSWYNGRVVKGDKCGMPAIMSYSQGGKTVHRCAKHVGKGQ